MTLHSDDPEMTTPFLQNRVCFFLPTQETFTEPCEGSFPIRSNCVFYYGSSTFFSLLVHVLFKCLFYRAAMRTFGSIGWVSAGFLISRSLPSRMVIVTTSSHQ